MSTLDPAYNSNGELPMNSITAAEAIEKMKELTEPSSSIFRKIFWFSICIIGSIPMFFLTVFWFMFIEFPKWIWMEFCEKDIVEPTPIFISFMAYCQRKGLNK